MDTESSQQQTRERSTAYPSTNLEQAVDWIGEVRKNLGKGPYSREDAVKAMGYKGISGASARSVASLVYYGLLDRVGNTYSVSKLAEEILHPTDETGQSRRKALAVAAGTPRLFGSLIKKFDGQALPNLLENILLREGIALNYAKEVAATFKHTLQYAGLLENGVVKAPISGTVEGGTNESSMGVTPTFMPTQNNSNQGQGSIVSLSGEGWTIIAKSSKRMKPELRKKLFEIGQALDTEVDVEEHDKL